MSPFYRAKTNVMMLAEGIGKRGKGRREAYATRRRDCEERRREGMDS